jgi:hypothetical protein
MLPASFGYPRDSTFVALFSKTNTAHFEFTHVSVWTAANFTSVISTNFKFRFATPFFNHRLFGHSKYLLYALNGIPINFRSSLASSSVFAVVTTIIFIPRILSILSYSISGKINCSLRPME